jgi:hypothetical protein
MISRLMWLGSALLTASLIGYPAASAAGTGAAAAANTQLEGVACVSAHDCWAVGTRGPQTGRHSFAEHWNGATWSVKASPDPSGATDSQLTAVACPGARDCLAVGVYLNSARHQLLFGEHWNGRKWSLVPVRHPLGSTQNTLTGISCTSGRNCFTVGAAAANTRPLAEHWNGKAWSLVTTRSVGVVNVLQRVSCGGATNCWAVGFWSSGASGGTLTERWRRDAWRLVKSPASGTSGADLMGDSCLRSVCLAVGGHSTGPALAERWNGSKWVVKATGSPAGATAVRLRAVSCTSATACMAAGDFSTATTEEVLAERWNGSRWALGKVPDPAGATESVLLDVACPGAGNCWAVGFHTTATGTGPVTEHWNGSKWVLVQQ